MTGYIKSTLRNGTLLLSFAALESWSAGPGEASSFGLLHNLPSSIPDVARGDHPADAAPIRVKVLIQDVDGGKRISMSGRLRMLSQRITAAGCNLAAGVAVDESREAVLSAQAEFTAILAALTVGDEALGIIGPETQRKTLAHIEDVKVIWAQFDTALNNIVAGKDVDAQVATISGLSDGLLEAAVILASDVVSEYANPAEMTQAMALTTDIAGRQRMLTQKIAKELCGVVNNNPAIGDTAKLQATIAMYEATMVALHDGMPEAGIAPPATPEIKAALEAAVADWAEIKAELARATGPGTLSTDEQAALFNRLTKKMGEMNEITKMYTAIAATTF
ncbi:MAG: type IV pili methyl-accepting chemotaxis transducer N-terminal domain-containing protein [Paracoccaceae bacterium]